MGGGPDGVEDDVAPETAAVSYRRWTLSHPLVLHWVLNPGVAFNEVFLGQRLPKVMLVDQTSDRPFMERCFVPCPACGERHDARLWSRSNAIGHWFGYVCPECGGNIPCLWNLTSLLVLGVTAPAWIVPVLLWRKRWLEFERRRVVAKRQGAAVDAASVPWTRIGVLGFGGSLWLLTGVLPQVVALVQGDEVDGAHVLSTLPVCLVVGLGWGLSMRYFMTRRPRPSAYGSR